MTRGRINPQSSDMWPGSGTERCAQLHISQQSCRLMMGRGWMQPSKAWKQGSVRWRCSSFELGKLWIRVEKPPTEAEPNLLSNAVTAVKIPSQRPVRSERRREQHFRPVCIDWKAVESAHPGGVRVCVAGVSTP